MEKGAIIIKIATAVAQREDPSVKKMQVIVETIGPNLLQRKNLVHREGLLSFQGYTLISTSLMILMKNLQTNTAGLEIAQDLIQMTLKIKSEAVARNLLNSSHTMTRATDLWRIILMINFIIKTAQAKEPF